MSDGTDFAAYYDEYGDGRNPMLALVGEYVMPYRGLFAFALLIHVVYALMQVVPPYLIGVAVDLVSGGPESFSLLFVPEVWLPRALADQFLLVSALLVGAMALTAVLQGVHWVSWEYLQKHANHEARTDAYDQTQRLGLEFFENERNSAVIDRLLEHVGPQESETADEGDRPLDGETFVFTGSLDSFTRSEAQDLVERHGGSTTGSVSGNTDYLVVGDNPGQRKQDDAVDEGIPMLDETAFLSLLDERGVDVSGGSLPRSTNGIEQQVGRRNG